jgi:integrase
VVHHAALPWSDISAFMQQLASLSAVSARALEFLILTAARTGEVIGARWSEVDMDAALWTIPASRMKAAKEHRVPLSEAAAEILHGMARLRGRELDAFVFPGQVAGKPLSNMSMIALIKRMRLSDVTPHGFRSTFRDWAGETTGHPSDVIELALAHTVGSKVEAAYRRGDMFQKRRALMDDWAAFCCAKPEQAAPTGSPANASSP